MNLLCSGCKKGKNIALFKKVSLSKNLRGYGSYCRECGREATRKWRKDNKEKIREQQLIYNYGITQEQYNALRILQENKCAICKQESEKTLNVDHCHNSNKIRGLLCNRCNKVLGSFEDKIELFQTAIAYLIIHEGRK